MVGKVLEMDFNTLLLLVGVISFVGVFATVLHIRIGKLAIKFVERIDYQLVSIFSFVFVLLLVVFFTGFFGLYMALLATSLGLLPILAGVSRTHCMGVLIIPTIFYFLGFTF